MSTTIMVIRTEDLLEGGDDMLAVSWEDWSATASPGTLDIVAALGDGESADVDGISYMKLEGV